MRRLTLIFVTALGIALAATAQGAMMSGGAAASGQQSGSMMTAAPAASGTTMMGSAPQSTDSTMMGAAPQAGAAMKADPVVGNRLRYAMSTGMKVIFTDLMAAESLAQKGPTVLFFAADWCPNCQADLKDINANGARLKQVSVVVLDYDKTAELKTKYGVTVQDTYVQINGSGEELGIWNGGGVDGILAHLQKAM